MKTTGSEHILVGDHFVNARVERIVQAIKDYEPMIDVDYLPVGARETAEKGGKIVILPAFKIVYRPIGQPEFVLFHVKDEESFDERVLMRIIQNDNRNGQQTWNEFQALEKAQQMVAKVAQQDAMEEMHEMARAIIRTPLNTYRVNKDLIIKDGIPFNAKGL